MPDGHRIAVAIFARGGSNRPRTIAEAARAIYDGFKSVFSLAVRPSGAHQPSRCFSHIVARGKIGRSPEADLVERYLKRIAWPTKVTELPDSGGKAAGSAPANSVSDRARRARRGAVLDRPCQSSKRWRDGGKREARFLIGAADGHDEAQRAGADLLLSFGPATWPHLLARAMLAEQLFRATSILANHPYHREG